MPQFLAPIALESSIAQVNEDTYVHSVYDSIASHFSQTRYKPWPLIQAFLDSLTPGSIGLDSGTGNGKYLPLDKNGSIYMVGLDRSANLLKIAKMAGGKERDVVLGDAIGKGWRCYAFVRKNSCSSVDLIYVSNACEFCEGLCYFDRYDSSSLYSRSTL